MKRLVLSKTVLFLCDIQEAFRPHMLPHQRDVLYQRCNFLSQSAKIFGIPRFVSVQYPKGLGHTVPEIELVATAESPIHSYEKTKFSMLTDEVIGLGVPHYSQVLICGAETHVCVQQTVLDLLEREYDVFVVADAVASLRAYDKKIALDRMSAAGAIITTAESAVFDLMRDANHPKFRTISQLIKSTNLLPWSD